MSVYLDHAATTPLRECALEAWTRAQRDLAATPGNPAALHFGGRRARRMLGDAREQVAAALGADIHEVIFTSGAIHHTVGMQSAAHIVAVCDDPDAPIFEIADFGVVGDVSEVVPAALAIIEEARSQA